MSDLVGKRLRLLAALSVALAVSGCFGDAARTYLEAQPEYNLVYPGATLISSETGGGMGAYDEPSVVKTFKTATPLGDVADWYGRELGNRQWVGTENEDGLRGRVYDWWRPCLQLSLDGRPPVDGMTEFEVVFSLVGCSDAWDRASDLQTLRETPEAVIAPPRAQPFEIAETFQASRQPDATTFLHVERSYRWDGTTSAAVDFYDNSLLPLGWTRVDVVSGERFSSWDVAAKWQKDSVVAVLAGTKSGFIYGLGELLDTHGSPLPPRSAIPNT